MFYVQCYADSRTLRLNDPTTAFRHAMLSAAFLIHRSAFTIPSLLFTKECFYNFER